MNDECRPGGGTKFSSVSRQDVLHARVNEEVIHAQPLELVETWALEKLPFQPVLIFLTDGEPDTNDANAALQIYQRIGGRLRQRQGERVPL